MKEPQQLLGIRNSLKKTNGISFIILILFVGIAYGVERIFKPSFSSTTLLALGWVMALIPAAFWLIFFYRQDKDEPEPKGMVLAVAVLGGLLASAIGIPLIETVFNVSGWIYDSIPTTLIGCICVIGFTQEFLKYAAVRFSVYNTAEFDERDDGIIYGTAAGVGFALAMNIAYVVNTKGALLGMAAIHVVLNTLAQASFAGISGYFLSKEKVDRKPFWWTPLGVILAAVVNGVFFYLYGTLTQPRITIRGGFVNPWAGLALAVVVAALITYGLSWLIQKDNKNQPRLEDSTNKPQDNESQQLTGTPGEASDEPKQ